MRRSSSAEGCRQDLSKSKGGAASLFGTSVRDAYAQPPSSVPTSSRDPSQQSSDLLHTSDPCQSRPELACEEERPEKSNDTGHEIRRFQGVSSFYSVQQKNADLKPYFNPKRKKRNAIT